MNEDSVLSGLRDIHLPDSVAVTVPSGLAVWPFVVFGGVVFSLLLIRFLRRNRWRRLARRELDAILGETDAAARWQMLLQFAANLGHHANRSISLPGVAFRRPEHIDAAGEAEMVAFLTAEIAR